MSVFILLTCPTLQVRRAVQRRMDLLVVHSRLLGSPSNDPHVVSVMELGHATAVEGRNNGAITQFDTGGVSTVTGRPLHVGLVVAFVEDEWQRPGAAPITTEPAADPLEEGVTASSVAQ